MEKHQPHQGSKFGIEPWWPVDQSASNGSGDGHEITNVNHLQSNNHNHLNHCKQQYDSPTHRTANSRSVVLYMNEAPAISEAEAIRRKAWVFYLPMVGRIQILKDPMGLICSSIIILYWVFGNWSTWLCILIPRYTGGQMSPIMLVLYAIISALCITSFLRATTLSPGRLDADLSAKDGWTVCQRCFKNRPPQTHHCSRCGHCVRKMDHHCPWINNCVGEDNQFAFILLVLYAYTMSLITLVLDILHLYYLPPCLACDKENFMVIHETGIMRLAIVMAVAMTWGGGCLYFSQHMSIMFNMPSIEFMKVQQKMFATGLRDFEWPQQTQSVYRVYKRVCGDMLCILWLLPCIRRRPYISQERLI